MNTIPPAISQYLIEARQAQMTDAEISQALIQAGWAQSVIKDALSGAPSGPGVVSVATPVAAAPDGQVQTASSHGARRRRMLLIGLGVLVVLVAAGYLYTAKYWLHSWPFAN